MKITRLINGENITIEITPDEIYGAEVEYFTEKICERLNIRDRDFASKAAEIFV